jgi:hypothetical protein
VLGAAEVVLRQVGNKNEKEERAMNTQRIVVRSVMVFSLVSLLFGMTAITGSMSGSQLAFAGGSPPAEVVTSADLPANFLGPGVCNFPIRVETSGKGGTINLQDGRVIFTSPMLNAVVTNLDDPSKKVTLNITGTFHVSIDPNGNVTTVVTGRNLMGDPVAGLVLAIGTFSFILDSTGNLIQPLAGTGQLIDVCGLIS